MTDNYKQLYKDQCNQYEELEAEYNEYKGLFLSKKFK